MKRQGPQAWISYYFLANGVHNTNKIFSAITKLCTRKREDVMVGNLCGRNSCCGIAEGNIHSETCKPKAEDITRIQKYKFVKRYTFLLNHSDPLIGVNRQ